jgi:membrane associated rhomboid family serine protease
MTMAPVGIRCPDHASSRGRRPVLRPAPVVRAQRQLGSTFAPVTKALIAINVGIYLITAVQGSGLNSPGGKLFDLMALSGGRFRDGSQIYNGVAQGEWWRLITAAFLHANVIHIAFNMFALWVIGGPVETYLGRARYLGLYIVAGLAGSAGALWQSPYGVTVGASGAIFGILGALLIIEWQATGRLAGQAMTLIVINLAFSFTFSGISWGGHVGGLIGGILATLSFARWGRGHAAYGRLGLSGALGLVVIAAASIAIAYWRVRGLA